MGIYRLIKESRIITLDTNTLVPVILVPAILYGGATCLTMTILVMIVLAMSMLYILQRWATTRTQFFYSWTICSAFYLLLVFEIVVIALLEVTQKENLVFCILVFCYILCLYKVRASVAASKEKDYSPVLTADCLHCPLCQIEIKNRYFHSVWLDTCISKTNYGYYILGLCISDVCLLYGSNLGLTTICQPYIFFSTILMPEDCSLVYYEYDLSLCFVACVYSLCYAACVTFVLLHQFIRYVPKHIGSLKAKRDPNVLSA